MRKRKEISKIKIISFEGLDKSGKHSQSELLKLYLISKGFKVMKSEFHRYDTPIGQLIMKWLKGEWSIGQHVIELIMTADKQAQQQWFDELEDDGYDFLILDRYILSQSAYSVANGIDSKWVVELQKYMRKPDLDIVIDIPAEVSMSRKGKYGDNDRYESNLEMLKRVRQNYLNFSTYYSAPIKKIVDGLSSIEYIHEDIIKIVVEEMKIE